jgi:hypothetical protein
MDSSAPPSLNTAQMEGNTTTSIMVTPESQNIPPFGNNITSAVNNGQSQLLTKHQKLQRACADFFAAGWKFTGNPLFILHL